MVDRQNFFDQPVKSSLRAYDNFQKVAIGYGDDYITGYLLNYNSVINQYKGIAIALSKQQTFDADPKAM